MAQQIIVYWRDIPSQVIVSHGRNKGKALLAARFQEAIDQAAMLAGMAESDAYVEQWRRETNTYECTGELQPCAEQIAADLEAKFSPEILQQITRNKGLQI